MHFNEGDNLIFDSHMHTKYSADSEMIAQEAIDRAKKIGLGVVFTEHLDYGLKSEADIDFNFEPEEYWREYETLRGLNVRLGVEVGMKSDIRSHNAEFIKRAPFDLVIGSIHLVDDYDIYYPDFYVGKDKETAYHKYFKAMIEEAAVGDFDVLAHIDYICRAAPYEDPEIDYATFTDDIDQILKIVVERDKVLELNTRRLNTRRGLKELVPIYSKYKKLGGKYITIGSDAHRVAAVGNYFDVALDFARELNLTVVTFCQRRIEICTSIS